MTVVSEMPQVGLYLAYILGIYLPCHRRCVRCETSLDYVLQLLPDVLVDSCMALMAGPGGGGRGGNATAVECEAVWGSAVTGGTGAAGGR